MTSLSYLIAAVFLPLFPFSMLFNRLFARLGNAWLRAILLLAWPQAGLLIIAAGGGAVPTWVLYWAVFTACFYAFRALTLRDLALWVAYMATSAWSLLWVVALFAGDEARLALQAFGLSVPLLVVVGLAARLESTFGAAYAGAGGGLAQSAPRLSLLLVASVLAAVGTPLFPAFFILLAAVTQLLPVAPLAALCVLSAWLLWAWGATRLIGGMVVGRADCGRGGDLDVPASTLSGIVLAVLAVLGIGTLGYLL